MLAVSRGAGKPVFVMKRGIINRIQALGGNTDGVKGESLQADLRAMKFDTVLYPKTMDAPWAKAEDAEPIPGLGEFVEANQSLLKSDRAGFRDLLIQTYYKDTREALRQVFFRNDLFTPFKEGTDDYKEWAGEWAEDDFRNVIAGTEMDLMFIGHSYGFPDSLFICLSDPDQENPLVYGTDHETYFDEIVKVGTLEDYFNSFMTPDELIEIIEKRFKLETR